MQDVQPKWRGKGLVLVCERCYKERIPEEAPEAAQKIGDFDLRSWLKTRLKEDNRWGPIRAISTSCQDICAKSQVTITLAPQNRPTQTYVLDPIEDKEALYQKIIETMPDDKQQ
jgi:hypothetical protein